MTTVIPSSKGQITIPSFLRKKYHISENTPVTFVDKGNGILEIQIMKIIPHHEYEANYYETDKEMGVIFKNGIHPQKLIDLLQDHNE
jgi:AbrB family looped-hinge helix DNA binding protein